MGEVHDTGRTRPKDQSLLVLEPELLVLELEPELLEEPVVALEEPVSLDDLVPESEPLDEPLELAAAAVFSFFMPEELDP